MTKAIIHVFLLSCTHVMYELGIQPELRPHIRSHIPGKASIAHTCHNIMCCGCLIVVRLNQSLNRNWIREAN